MFIELVESQRKSRRALGGTAASVVLHSALISLAIVATANARTQREPPIRGVRVTFMPQRIAAPTSPNSSRQPGRVTSRNPSFRPAVAVPVPVEVGTGIPEILPPGIPSAAIGLEEVPASAGVGKTAPNGGLGVPMAQWQVDKEVRAFASNSAPVYPDLLRSRGIEGDVYARFVVDETGRVDMKSVEIVSASSSTFAASVRHALERARFQPAEAAGRKVAQLVEQRFQFRLDR